MFDSFVGYIIILSSLDFNVKIKSSLDSIFCTDWR
nr:MAG TPA: hypothetical protein [Caudoviricetes sp.]